MPVPSERELSQKHCVPCRGGQEPMSVEAAREFLSRLTGWELVDGVRIVKVFTFADFAQALAFVNRVGALAEAEGHHPDILLSWGRVRIELWTHKIGGLSESDIILAAKIDQDLAAR